MEHPEVAGVCDASEVDPEKRRWLQRLRPTGTQAAAEAPEI